MILYLESSAFAKWLLLEEGWEAVRSPWEIADLVVASPLTYVEARAALAAARRNHRHSTSEHRRALDDLERDWAGVAELELTDRVARIAGDLTDRRGLRGCDAVHVASALVSPTERPIMLTFDRALASAALAEGIAVAPASG